MTAVTRRNNTPLNVLCEAERIVATVEGNELALEEDISVDRETTCSTGLKATEAVCKAWVSEMF